MLRVKFQFDVQPDASSLRLQECAVGSDRLCFLYTGGGKSELKAFDFSGHPLRGVMLKSRAHRIWPACAGGGVLVVRPRPSGESHVEEYSPDLKFERAGTYDDSFETVFCSGKKAVALDHKEGTLDLLNFDAASIERRSPLAVPGDDPVILTSTQSDFYVQVRVFSGVLQTIGYDGLLRSQRTLSGPGLDAHRADLAPEEGMFGGAATDGSGVYVLLGRSSPSTGAEVQKYDFDSNFVGGLRLPFLRYEEFKKPPAAGQLFSNRDGALGVSKLVVKKPNIYLIDFMNRRVVAFDCGIVCGQ